jgi:hypothetical protein
VNIRCQNDIELSGKPIQSLSPLWVDWRVYIVIVIIIISLFVITEASQGQVIIIGEVEMAETKVKT